MNKLKKRWGIESNIQLLVILLVFALTGSTSLIIAKPVLSFLSVEKENMGVILYWIIRILIVFPIYQLVLLVIGFIFGQFRFFWNIEKKILSRFGLMRNEDKK